MAVAAVGLQPPNNSGVHLCTSFLVGHHGSGETSANLLSCDKTSEAPTTQCSMQSSKTLLASERTLDQFLVTDLDGFFVSGCRDSLNPLAPSLNFRQSRELISSNDEFGARDPYSLSCLFNLSFSLTSPRHSRRKALINTKNPNPI